MTRRRWALAAAGVVIAGALLAATLPGWLRRLEFFKVRRVEVLGSRYLSGREVVGLMRVPAGASLFDDASPYQRAVFRVRGVREVTVTRRWPGTLVVRLRESDPVALAPTDKGLALVDDRGWVLPFDPTRSPADLPVAPADPTVARALARVRDIAPGLFAAVRSAARVGDDVAFDLGGRRLLVRSDVTPSQLRALAVVLDDLQRLGRGFRELDARFTNQVIVRGMTS